MGDDLIHHRREASREGGSSILGLTMLEEPVVEEKGPDRVAWEYHSVTLTRVPGYGFGIAVSGGRDNPHFANGDPAIAISDVLKSGPAEGKLLVNDRILSANGVSLENVDYATAVQVLRDNSTVQLVVKRRVLLQPEPQAFRVVLTKNGGSGRKGDFGLNLSTKLYVKDCNSLKTGNLQEGDVILRINNTPCDGLSLKDAKKLIENTKDKLQLVIKREPTGGFGNEMGPGAAPGTRQALLYSSQNLYVQPPRRPSEALMQKSDNLIQPALPPPRPPPPMEDSLGASGMNDYYSSKSEGPGPSGSRLISFVKQGPLGIRLAGGNTVGIFVTAVQPGSQAAAHGLSPGDKILQVNNRELSQMTREDAVNLLMSLNDDVKLLVLHGCLAEYESVIGKNLGDSFFIKTHFAYEKKGTELQFKIGEIFQVIDTLVTGSLGYWGVLRVDTGEKGIIPNLVKAREIWRETQGDSGFGSGTSTFFRRKKDKDTGTGGYGSSEPYERVVLKHPGFMRPVVLLGAVGDVARERLVHEHPDLFAIPAIESHSSKSLKLSGIREVISRGQHAILDISPSMIEKLNSSQLYPIVVLVKVDNKKSLKDIRGLKGSRGSSTGTLLGRKSPRKLLAAELKIEAGWSHVITNFVTVSSDDNWLRRVKEVVDKEQSHSIWVSEDAKPCTSSDECLFPLQPSTRNSYASSPESDLDTTNPSSSPSKHSHSNGKSNVPIELPNYNEPPAYSIQQHMDGYGKRGQQDMYPILSIGGGNGSSNNILEKTAGLHLDHSPPDSPMGSRGGPPRVDRSNKPKSATERLFGDYSSGRNTERRMTPGKNYNSHESLNGGGAVNGAGLRNYDHHDVYRFTRSTAQPSQKQGNSSGYSPYKGLEDRDNHQPGLYKSSKESTNGQYRYDSLYDNTSSLYNSLYATRSHMDRLNGNGVYSEESSGSPYRPPPPPKVKPVPPPKPTKPVRSDLLNGKGDTNGNSFYLNVPMRDGHRGPSAFELYRKESTSPTTRCMVVSPSLGGILETDGVKLIIPPSAVSEPQEIFLTVYHNNQDKTHLLSPIVKLGPEGLEFEIPVQLIVPHSCKGASCSSHWEDFGHIDSSNILHEPQTSTLTLFLDKF